MPTLHCHPQLDHMHGCSVLKVASCLDLMLLHAPCLNIESSLCQNVCPSTVGPNPLYVHFHYGAPTFSPWFHRGFMCFPLNCYVFTWFCMQQGSSSCEMSYKDCRGKVCGRIRKPTSSCAVWVTQTGPREQMKPCHSGRLEMIGWTECNASWVFIHMFRLAGWIQRPLSGCHIWAVC